VSNGKNKTAHGCQRGAACAEDALTRVANPRHNPRHEASRVSSPALLASAQPHCRLGVLLKATRAQSCLPSVGGRVGPHTVLTKLAPASRPRSGMRGSRVARLNPARDSEAFDSRATATPPPGSWNQGCRESVVCGPYVYCSKPVTRYCRAIVFVLWIYEHTSTYCMCRHVYIYTCTCVYTCHTHI
jgi:hypothetical protein